MVNNAEYYIVNRPIVTALYRCYLVYSTFLGIRDSVHRQFSHVCLGAIRLSDPDQDSQ